MKSLLKIGSLSLALIAVVFMLNTNAQTPDAGDLTLEITGESGYCEYGTTLDLGQTGFSYDARTISGNFLVTTTTGAGNTPWNCTDSYGVAAWALTIQSSDVENMDTGLPAHTIPATSVKIYNPTAAVVSGACTSVQGGNAAGTAINSATTILEKLSEAGDACRVQTDFVDLTVDLVASQAIGQYSGTLTVSVPTL